MLPSTGQGESVIQNQTEEGDATCTFHRLRVWNGGVEVWIPSHQWYDWPIQVCLRANARCFGLRRVKGEGASLLSVTCRTVAQVPHIFQGTGEER